MRSLLGHRGIPEYLLLLLGCGGKQTIFCCYEDMGKDPHYLLPLLGYRETLDLLLLLLGQEGKPEIFLLLLGYRGN
jgi:hypothetical protein